LDYSPFTFYYSLFTFINARIVFDIETAGFDFESLEEPVRDYLLKWAETEDEKNEVRESLSFYPLTVRLSASVCSILIPARRCLLPEQQRTLPPIDEEGIRYEAGDEQEIIRKFWIR